MSRGRRYNREPKLNIKKVIAVVIAIAVIVMFVVTINKMMKSDISSTNLVSKSYFLINKDNKWGVIDNNSKTILEPIYDEPIIIPDNKKDLFICTYDVNYEEQTYETKVYNSKGKEMFQEYDTVKAIENYDENKNLWYEEDILLVSKDGKYGLINFKGEKVLDITYENIYSLKGIENSLITEKDKKLGLVNNSGKVIIENKYDAIDSLGKESKTYIVKENDKYGVYGILESKYQEVKKLDNKTIFCVKEDGEYKVINTEGKVVFTEKFDSIETIKDNVIVYKYKDSYCAYSIDTSKKLDKTYKELKYTQNNTFIEKTKDKYGIVIFDGTSKVEEKYTAINYYADVNIYELEEDGTNNSILDKDLKEIAKGIVNETNYEKSYIKVWTEEGYKYFKLNGEEENVSEVLTQNSLFLKKQNNKYGFVDKDGNVVVDYIYDDAKEQNEFGYIAVKKDGLWGSLDKNGKVISDTKYNLDENLLIDFIGEYHIGKDINFIYYINR